MRFVIIAMIVAALSAAGAQARTLASSGSATSITRERIHVYRDHDAVRVQTGRVSYEVIAPRRFAHAPDLAEYVGKSLEDFFNQKQIGDRVAFECVPGFDLTLALRVTPYGLPANYSMFECYGMNSSNRWYITAPNGVRERIAEEVTALGGHAAAHGLFGPRGSVVFLGYINEYCLLLNCYRVITTEHWMIAGNVNDLGETIRQGSYDAGAAADFWKTVISLGG